MSHPDPKTTGEGRLAQMATMRSNGSSYAGIGRSFGISGERVRQLLLKGSFVKDSSYTEFRTGSDYHRACTIAGLEIARAVGRIGGRPTKFPNELILETRRLGLRKGALHLGMTVAGFHKAVKRSRSAESV